MFIGECKLVSLTQTLAVPPYPQSLPINPSFVVACFVHFWYPPALENMSLYLMAEYESGFGLQNILRL